MVGHSLVPQIPCFTGPPPRPDMRERRFSMIMREVYDPRLLLTKLGPTLSLRCLVLAPQTKEMQFLAEDPSCTSARPASSSPG